MRWPERLPSIMPAPTKEATWLVTHTCVESPNGSKVQETSAEASGVPLVDTVSA